MGSSNSSTGTPCLRSFRAFLIIYRWHADVKPDNILSVQGKFKLSDPGFAKFVRKTDNDPEAFLLGGTETYGKACRFHIPAGMTPDSALL